MTMTGDSNMTKKISFGLSLFSLTVSAARATEYDHTPYDISTQKEIYSVFTMPPQSFHSSIRAVGCFLEHDRHILLLKRVLHKAEGGTWGIPGGKIDHPETALTAVRREVHEETGIVVEEDGLLEKIGINYLYLPTKQVEFHMYRLCLSRKPEILLSLSEHSEYCWETSEAALKMNLMPGEVESFIRYERHVSP